MHECYVYLSGGVLFCITVARERGGVRRARLAHGHTHSISLAMKMCDDLPYSLHPCERASYSSA